MMENVLVTGGGGFLGKAIAEKLVGLGVRVTSFSRNAYPELTRMGVDQIRGDLTDANRVAEAVNGMDTVFHTAAKPGAWGPYNTYYRTNVQGTVHVIDACKKHTINALIHTSSPSVIFGEADQENVDESAPYPEKFLAAYPETKALAEKEVIRAAGQGLPAIILRPHLIWGPGDNHLFPRIIQRAKRLKRVGREDDLVDTIYIDNAAQAHIQAAQALTDTPSLSGTVYFISQDEPVSKWWMIDQFLAAAGLPPVRGRVSAKTAYRVGCLLEALYKTFGIKSEPPMTRFVAKELATSHWFNIARAKKDLGYRVEVSTEEGLARLKQWLIQKNGQKR